MRISRNDNDQDLRKAKCTVLQWSDKKMDAMMRSKLK